MPVLKRPKLITHQRVTQTVDSGGGFVNTTTVLGTYQGDYTDAEIKWDLTDAGVITRLDRTFIFLPGAAPAALSSDQFVVAGDTYTVQQVFDSYISTYQVGCYLLKSEPVPNA